LGSSTPIGCPLSKNMNTSIPSFKNFASSSITEAGFKGDTATNTLKPAKIDTGATVQVPLFINVGDKIKVDTREGKYIERVNK
jgi:hypothetical protein